MADFATEWAEGVDGGHDEPEALDFFDVIKHDDVQALERLGYAIVETFFPPTFAVSLLDELRELVQSGRMQPNRTHFSSPNAQGEILLFSKPNIFELDLHESNSMSRISSDGSKRSKFAALSSLFEESSANLARAIKRYVEEPNSPLGNLVEGDRGRTIKLQWNRGNGGCFPWHYDNPGPPNRRQMTCVIYLNPSWTLGDGGEICLLPFLAKEKISVEPIFNRAVLFRSDFILHRVERNFKDRYCLTIWVDGTETNTSAKSQLRLTTSALDDMDATVSMLQASPVQRSLSRAVYKELYLTSLKECMGDAPGADEMVNSHMAHMEQVKSNKPLTALVDALRLVGEKQQS